MPIKTNIPGAWSIFAPVVSCASAAGSSSNNKAGKDTPAALRPGSSSSRLDVYANVDPSMLFVAAPGDFLGPFRYALELPPFTGGACMSLQELGESYKDYCNCNTEVSVATFERQMLLVLCRDVEQEWQQYKLLKDVCVNTL